MLQERDDRWELDSDSSTIRCLSHVIHLAVTDLLVGLEVVKKSNARGMTDDGNMTEETAEMLGNDEIMDDERDESDILRDQRAEAESEFDVSPFEKVLYCYDHKCGHASQGFVK